MRTTLRFISAVARNLFSARAGHSKDAALMPSHKRLESPPIASQYPLYEDEIVLISDIWFGRSSFCIVKTSDWYWGTKDSTNARNSSRRGLSLRPFCPESSPISPTDQECKGITVALRLWTAKKVLDSGLRSRV